MHFRNALSLVRRTAVASLGALVLALPLTAVADASDILSRFSLSPPSLGGMDADAPENVLMVEEIRVAPQLSSTIDLTAPSDDLWVRIRNGFSMTNLNDSLVLTYQAQYQNHPDALRRMVERARPYLYHIVQELEARGMPTELALLPMVESAFNPNAYSHAKASGLWQFIPSTGKRFNLEQNWWRDDRRDVLASTSAALDYLQTIYEMQGDWHLALASYNWGEGAVKRAVQKNEARGLPTDYPNLTMPNETRNYVPKLQALKNILGNPALAVRLGVPRIPNEPYFATLETPKAMDVKTVARLANMSTEEFQRLNPSHNRPVIRSDTPVVIPAEKMAAFRSNLASNQAPLSEWQAYTVTSPERLEAIATRFGTSTAELARVNGLGERVRLGAGSTLLVPGAGSAIGLNNLLNASAPQHIIEPEPVVVQCGKAAKGKHGKRAAKACPKGGKSGKAEAKSGKNDRKAGGKAEKQSSKGGSKAAKDHGKASSKAAAKPTSKAASPNKGKAAAPAKAAHGRR